MATLQPLYKTCFIILCIVGLSACTTSNTPIMVGDIVINDPYEEYNRAMFEVNEGIDAVLIEPATIAYRTVVPQIARDGVHNVLENLKSPIYLANEVLQGDWKDAGVVTRRFLVNSVAGLGGLIDVASWEGDVYLPEDFGQTLAKWGVADGSYFVWPLFGPSTTRDSFGRLVDLAFDPIFWYTMNVDDKEWINYTRTGLTILDTKDRLMDAMNDLEKNSFDYYAAVRSVVYQRRKALINDQDPSEGYGADIAIPDYDDESGWQ